VRNHWFDVVQAAVGPGYRVVQTVNLLQMRLIVLAAEPLAHLVREVRVGFQAGSSARPHLSSTWVALTR
jgi:hypothetical protein